MDYVSYNLKYLRSCYNYSQEQMGKIIGKSGDAISRYELGQRQMKDKDVQKLCTYFGLEPSDLRYRKLDEQTTSLLNEMELELLSICKLLTNEQLLAIIEVARNMVK